MLACSPASSSCVCRNSKGKFKGAGGGTTSFQPGAGMFVGGGGRGRGDGRISQREEGEEKEEMTGSGGGTISFQPGAGMFLLEEVVDRYVESSYDDLRVKRTDLPVHATVSKPTSSTRVFYGFESTRRAR
jgi:hypothetical protein